MAPSAARPASSLPVLAAGLGLALALSACGSGDGSATRSTDGDHAGHATASSPSGQGGTTGTTGAAQQEGHQDGPDAGHDHGDPGDHPQGVDHSDHEHGHSSAAELTGMLMTARQLPAGYQAGHAHGTTDAGAAPTLDPACAPLAELVGTHPSVRQSEHPEAERVFSKSHFGPTVNQVVIDYGEPELAAAAVDRLAAAAQDCDTYVQSTSRIGAGTYTVSPGREVADHPGGESVRLQAVGDDFTGIGWGVWWVQHGARVLGVSFRTVPGGDDAELDDAVRAAVAAVDAADS